MQAAGSIVGGTGLNCIPYHAARYDGQRQEVVIRELGEIVDAMEDEDEQARSRQPSSLLSKFQIYCNRAADLNNWLGKDEVPEDLVTEYDDYGHMKLRYDGEFQETGGGGHMREGHATVRMSNGILFIGLFQNGAPHGNGTITFPSGNKWDGNFDHGRVHGEGVFTWSRPASLPAAVKFRRRYVGWLEDGRVESIGKRSTFIHNKDVYEGEFRHGVAHGQGVFLWEDGRYYDGEWVCGKAHGAGKLVLKDGTIKTGHWEPCSAHWYLPLKVPAKFWPGQLLEVELVKTDRDSIPAVDRPR